ncbi:putative efflux protein, MATE family [Brevinema andersonii]|uniref:Multidrug export protein MepA n=1 Tax=Brevinema andersonii TaxID=34097 RepID=A0A1I1DH91_BREAD|nr:MATE family efflux transporter [Brevinema andersonii]SFB72110.1 putative efflux protein, MATE family [Brevinema andersonii]
MSSDSEKLLASDNIIKSMIILSVPMMVSGFFDALYNLVDSIFVGNFVGSKALAALAVNNTIQVGLLAVGALFSVGIASIISRALGTRNHAKVEKTLITGIVIGFLTTLSMSWLMLMFLDNILRTIGSSEEVLSYSREYGSVILWGGFILPLNSILGGSLRAKGLSKKVMILMLCGALTNIFLDALFIIIFGWGVSGAAWATICAQMLVTILALNMVISEYQLKFNSLNCKNLSIRLFGEILLIGGPAFLRSGIFALMNLTANRQLSPYGAEAVAAFGIVNRMMHLAYQPIFGSNLGLQPMIGYNYGARHYSKVKQIIKKGIVAGTIVGLIPSILLVMTPVFLFRLFTDSPEIITYAEKISFAVGLTFFMYGYQIISSGALQAIGHPKEAFILSLARPIIMVLTMNILPKFIGMAGVWYTFTITDITNSLLTAVIMNKEFKLLTRKQHALQDL